MAKRKTNSPKLTEIQQVWIALTLLIGAIIFASLWISQPVKADGMNMPSDTEKNGVQLNLSGPLFDQAIAKFLGVSVSDVQDSESLGAAVSPDLPWKYIGVGGRQSYQQKIQMTATSSVLCAVQNPTSSTSTILNFTANVTGNGFDTSANVYLSTSTGQFSTSTVALSKAVPTGTGKWNFSWIPNSATTTSSAVLGMSTGDANVLPGINPTTFGTYYTLGPTEWLVFRVATTTAGTFSSYQTGTCSYEIVKN